jgi:phosphoglycolate phosphatase
VINLVVFDLDGTLVDSRRDLADATNALIVELGGHALSEERVTAMVGDGAAMLVRRALTAASIDPDTPGVLDRFLTHYDARLLDHTRPYGGMVETLAALSRRARLAVLTNKPSAATERLLTGLELRSLFADVVGGDFLGPNNYEGRKPEPNGLIGIIRRASVTPAETLLVGDSAIDLATARSVGTRICLARYGFGFHSVATPLDDDVAVIDSPRDLVPLLGALNNLEPRQV